MGEIPGQKLEKLPDAQKEDLRTKIEELQNTYTVKRGETLGGISQDRYKFLIGLDPEVNTWVIDQLLDQIESQSYGADLDVDEVLDFSDIDRSLLEALGGTVDTTLDEPEEAAEITGDKPEITESSEVTMETDEPPRPTVPNPEILSALDPAQKEAIKKEIESLNLYHVVREAEMLAQIATDRYPLLFKANKKLWEWMTAELIKLVGSKEEGRDLEIGTRIDFRGIQASLLEALGYEVAPPRPAYQVLDEDLYYLETASLDIDTILSPDVDYIRVRDLDGNIRYFQRHQNNFYSFNPDEGTVRVKFVPVAGMFIEALPQFTEALRLEDILPWSECSDFAQELLPEYEDLRSNEPLVSDEIEGQRVVLRTHAMASLKKALLDLELEGISVKINDSFRDIHDQSALKRDRPFIADLPGLSAHQTGGALDISFQTAKGQALIAEAHAERIELIEDARTNSLHLTTSLADTAIEEARAKGDIKVEEAKQRAAELIEEQRNIFEGTMGTYGFYRTFQSEDWHFEYLPTLDHQRAFDSYNVVSGIEELDTLEENPNFQLILETVQVYIPNHFEAARLSHNIYIAIQACPDFPVTRESITLIVATLHRESELQTNPDISEQQLDEFTNLFNLAFADTNKLHAFVLRNNPYPEGNLLLSFMRHHQYITVYDEFLEDMVGTAQLWKDTLPNGIPEKESDLTELKNELLKVVETHMEPFMEMIEKLAQGSDYLPLVKDTKAFIARLRDRDELQRFLESCAQPFGPQSLGIGQINIDSARYLFGKYRDTTSTGLQSLVPDVDAPNHELEKYIYSDEGGVFTTVLYIRELLETHEICNDDSCNKKTGADIVDMLPYIIADYNAGTYASRNTYFQTAVNHLARSNDLDLKKGRISAAASPEVIEWATENDFPHWKLLISADSPLSYEITTIDTSEVVEEDLSKLDSVQYLDQLKDSLETDDDVVSLSDVQALLGSNHILTLDDGPSKNTLEILDVLDEMGVKAIFYLRGDKIDESEDSRQITREIVRRGHTIGYHTMGHEMYSSGYTPESLARDFEAFQELLNEVVGFEYPLTFVRIPGGNRNNWEDYEEARRKFDVLKHTRNLGIFGEDGEIYREDNWNVYDGRFRYRSYKYKPGGYERKLDYFGEKFNEESSQVFLLHDRSVDNDLGTLRAMLEAAQDEGTLEAQRRERPTFPEPKSPESVQDEYYGIDLDGDLGIHTSLSVIALLHELNDQRTSQGMEPLPITDDEILTYFLIDNAGKSLEFQDSEIYKTIVEAYEDLPTSDWDPHADSFLRLCVPQIETEITTVEKYVGGTLGRMMAIMDKDLYEESVALQRAQKRSVSGVPYSTRNVSIYSQDRFDAWFNYYAPDYEPSKHTGLESLGPSYSEDFREVGDGKFTLRGRHIRARGRDFYERTGAENIILRDYNDPLSSMGESNRVDTVRYAKWDPFRQQYAFLDHASQRVQFINNHRYEIEVTNSSIEDEIERDSDQFLARKTEFGYEYVELFGEGITKTPADYYDQFGHQYIAVNGRDAEWNASINTYLFSDGKEPKRLEFNGGIKYVIENREDVPQIAEKVEADIELIRKQFEQYADDLEVGEKFVMVNKHPDKQYVILARNLGDGKFEILARDKVSTGRHKTATLQGLHRIQRVSQARTWGRFYGGERQEYDYLVYDLSEGGGIALHTTNHPETLGQVASAGCVRVPFAFSRRIEGEIHMDSPVIIDSFA